MRELDKNVPHHTCLYCGKEMKQQWEEYESYFECDCKDAKKDREITEEIRRLENTRPLKKFKVIQKSYVVGTGEK